MKVIVGKILIVLFCILIINSIIVGREVQAANNCTRAIAHRGVVSNAPENTIDSILDAARERVDFAELDVQQTRDGKVVLMHDKSLKRLTGLNRTVAEMDYSQLDKLYIKENNKLKSRKEKIPTLESVIQKSKNKIKLDIEIKTYAYPIDLTKKVVSLIEKYNIENDCIITSFDYNVLSYVKQLNPKIRTSFLTCLPVSDVTLRNVDVFSVEKHFVTPKLIKDIHKNNKKIHVWTVNNGYDMQRLKDLNVDYIITDNIDGFNNTNNNHKPKNKNIFVDIRKIIGL